MRCSPLIFCLASWALMSLASALTFQIDFSYDAANGNFFGQTPLAKAAVEAAAADLGAMITTQLGAINTDVYVGKSGSTTATFNWSVNFLNPATGAPVTLQGISIAANTIRVYVAMQKLSPKATELGDGGPGGAGFSLVGGGLPAEWLNAVKNGQNLSNAAMSRGAGPVIGTLGGSSSLGPVNADYTLKYGAIVGNVWFNKDTNKDGVADDAATLASFWHYDHTKPVVAGKNDFYSVALHELIHSLGFGQSATWRTDHTGTTWLGARGKALNANNGALLVAGDNVHIANNFMSTRLSDGLPQEAVMDPTLVTGSRKLLTAMDLAFLGDLGYIALVLPVPVTGSADVVSNVEVFIQGSAVLKNAATVVSLEYGLDALYGKTKDFVLPASIPNLNAPTPVSLVLAGLEPGLTYHYRLKAVSPEGSAQGADATFTLPGALLGATITCDGPANGPAVAFSPLTVGGVPGSPAEGVMLFLPGDSLLQKIDSVTQGSFGTVAINGTNLTYKPGPNYFGEDTFSYTITLISPLDTPGVKPSKGPFRATVQVRSSTPSAPHTAALKGGAIPGAPAGTVYGTLSTPAAGPFAGNQQGAGGTQRALFSSNGMVRFKVNDVPQGLGGLKIAKFGDPSGHAVAANFKIGPGVTAKSDGVLLAGLEDGVLRVAAREGVLLSGMPAGVTIKSFGMIDGNGPVIFFFATLQGTGISSKNDASLCAASADGSVRILAQEGQLVDGKTVSILGSLVGLPGTLADGRWMAGTDAQPALGVRVTFSDKSQGIYMMPASGAAWVKMVGTNGELGLGSLGLPGFGPDGAAFIGTFKAGTPDVTASNDTALFFSQGGVTNLLARESDLAPGPDGIALPDIRFKTLADPVAGAGRRGAFTGTITGPNVTTANRTGLWSFTPGTKGVRLVARAGAPAPGGGKWATFPSLVMSDGTQGGAIFLATRAVEAGSPLTAKKNMGLWAIDSTGTLQPLVQTGQTMNVSGSNKKVASFVALKAAAGSMGAAQGYDNEGHVAVLATFDDRTVALVIAVVP